MNPYRSTQLFQFHPLPVLWAVCCGFSLVLTGWAGAQPAGAAPKALSVQLRELTPSHLAPATGALLPAGEDAGPVRLIGVDLLQNGSPLGGDCPKLDGNIPLEVVAYWCPAAVISGRVPMTIRFWSQDYMIGRGEDLLIGPTPGEPAWEPGGVYRQKHTVGLPQIAGAINGKVHLSIHLAAGASGGQESPALQQLDLLVTPRIGGARISKTILGAKLERGAEPLSRSFRLGRDASVTLPVGVRGRAIKGIVVISSFAYGTVAQDKPVVEVGVNDGSAAPRNLSLLSGVHTARSDYDYYAPGAVNHAKPPIVESLDADYLDASGAPFRRHRYLGSLALEPPVQNLESLTFHVAADVVVDVFEVALLYADPAAPAQQPSTAPAPAPAGDPAPAAAPSSLPETPSSAAPSAVPAEVAPDAAPPVSVPTPVSAAMPAP